MPLKNWWLGNDPATFFGFGPILQGRAVRLGTHMSFGGSLKDVFYLKNVVPEKPRHEKKNTMLLGRFSFGECFRSIVNKRGLLGFNDVR